MTSVHYKSNFFPQAKLHMSLQEYSIDMLIVKQYAKNI